MVQPANKRLVTEATLPAHVATQITTPGTETATALSATIGDQIKVDAVPRWKALTTYAAGDKVVNPSGDTVSAIAAFTSGAAYDATKWTVTPGLADRPVIRPLTMGHKILFLGDSHTEGVGTSNIRHSFARQTVHKVGTFFASLNYTNAGKEGDSSGAARTRLMSSYIDGDYGIIVIEVGANDVNLASPLGTYQTHITYMVKEAKKRGMTVVLVTLPPKEGSASTATSAQPLINVYNTWLRMWAPHNGCHLADVHAVLTDPVTGVLKTEYSNTPLVHMNDLGHAVVADVVAKTIRLALTQPLEPPVKMQDPLNLVTNGFMAGEGPIPTGWTSAASVSIVDDTSGELPGGRWLQFLLPTDGSARTADFVIPAAKAAVGDKLVMSCVVQIQDESGTWVNAASNLHTAFVAPSLLTSGGTAITPSYDYTTGRKNGKVYTIGPSWGAGVVPAGTTGDYIFRITAATPGTTISQCRIGAVQVINMTANGIQNLLA